jgi:hypothetical protein
MNPSTIAAKRIGDSANHALAINEQQVEPNALNAPLRVHRQDDFSGRDQPALLPG